MLSREIEKLLLSNPNESILGFSAIRIYFESFIIIKSLDKIRSYVRIGQEDNTIDALYLNLKREELYNNKKTSNLLFFKFSYALHIFDFYKFASLFLMYLYPLYSYRNEYSLS